MYRTKLPDITTHLQEREHNVSFCSRKHYSTKHRVQIYDHHHHHMFHLFEVLLVITAIRQ